MPALLCPLVRTVKPGDLSQATLHRRLYAVHTPAHTPRSVHCAAAKGGLPTKAMTQTLPQDYDAQPAAAKLDLLWKHITDTRYTGALPATDPDKNISGNVGNPLFLHATFEHPSDEVPKGHAPKVIHSFGSVAKVEMRLASGGAAAGFTGMFAADSIGLVRVSLARHQIESFSPGLAVKMMIDGQESKNMVALNSLEGQGADRNIFHFPMSNALSQPTKLPLLLVQDAFAATILTLHGHEKDLLVDLNPADKPENPRTMPLLDAAKVSPDGSPVDSPKEMYQVFYIPTPEMTRAYEAVKGKDYREALATFPAGTVLWDIAAKRHSPAVLGAAMPGTDAVHIGQMVTTSEFVASDYGDNHLFFQHMQHRSLDL